MPAYQKRLADFVQDESFLARRHAELLLLDPLVRDPGLRNLQQRYRDERSELERRQLALLFQEAVRDPHVRALHAPPADALAGESAEPISDLEALLSEQPEEYDPDALRRADDLFLRAQQAERLRDDGWTLAAIAGELGISTSTVRNDLRGLAEWKRGDLNAAMPPLPPPREARRVLGPELVEQLGL